MSSSQVNIEQQKHIREFVIDKISKIDPYNRPLMATLGQHNKPITNTTVTWPLQELRAPSSTNKNVHGFSTTFASSDITNRTEDYNYTQLLDQPVAVDLSMQAVDVAGLGVGKELTEQKELKTIEILNDGEASIVSTNDRVQPLPNTGTAGQMRGIQTWITTNAIAVGSGSHPSRTITPEAWLDLQIRTKRAGGMPNKAFMGLQCMDTVSSWVNRNQNTREVGNDGRRLTMLIEQIRSVGGLVDLVYSYHLTDAILLLETARWKLGWLRELKWHPYPEGFADLTGGNYKMEFTVVSLCEKASGKITNLSYTA